MDDCRRGSHGALHHLIWCARWRSPKGRYSPSSHRRPLRFRWYSQLHGCNADGKRHPSLMEKLSELEQELADTKAKIASCEPREVRLRLKGARRFADARLKELQLVLNREPRIARAEISKHVQKITLTPEGRTYIASGTWSVLGAENHGWCRGPGSHHGATSPSLLIPFQIEVAA